MALGRTFLISASTLMSGTVVAQAITFGLSFVLARLYDPAEFGHYSIFVGFAGAFGVASTGALDRVVLLGRSDSEARRAATTLLVLCIGLAVVVSIAGILLALLPVSRALPLSPFDFAVMVPLFMLFYAGAQVLTYSSLRQGRVRHLATLKISQSVVMGAVQVSTAALRSIPGLIIGNIAGWFVLFAAGMRWRLSLGHLARDLRRQSLVALVRRNWRYPRYVMPNEVLDGLSNQVPLFFVGMFVSLTAAGHYGLALMILSGPAALLGQAVGQAFLQHMGGAEDDPVKLRQATRRIWLGMALVGVVPFGAILLLGPAIFRVGFGTEWTDAGVIAQLLAALLFVRFVSSPTSTLYWKLNMQREQWYFSVAAACYRAGCYALLWTGLSLVTVIILHVVIEILAIAFYNFVLLRRLHAREREQRAAA